MTRVRSGLLMLCLLLATGPLRAQRGPVYRDASPDSLRQELARQRAGTAAVRIERLPASFLLLTQGWRAHVGDNPAWARPDFDDSAWDTLNPVRPRQALPPALSSGISWLRLRFRLGDSLRRESLLLTAGELGAAEFYINGRLVRASPEAGGPGGRHAARHLRPQIHRGKAPVRSFSPGQWPGAGAGG